MKTKTLRRIATVQQSKSIAGLFMRNHYYCQLLTPDCIYRDDETGRHLITLIKDVIPACIVDTSYEALRTVYADPSNRGLAVAGRYAMSQRITKRGELSNRKTISKSVLEAAGNPKGDQLGYWDSDPGHKLVCRETAWTAKHPEVLARGMDLFQEMNGVYSEVLTDEYAAQMVEVGKVSPSLRIAEAFTTATINKNLRTSAHRDEGDLKQGTGVMATLGPFAGGYLVLPEYGVAVDYQPGDVLLGDVHGLFHGNCAHSGERVTVILYVRERMHLCPTKPD